MLVCAVALKANVDQQYKCYKFMFSKMKNKIQKVSNYVFNPLLHSIVPHRGTSQTNLMCRSVDWFLYDRQSLEDKRLTISSIISTYLELVHVHLITYQFLVILGVEAFCIWFIFDKVWNLILKMGSMDNKSVCTVF